MLINLASLGAFVFLVLRTKLWCHAGWLIPLLLLGAQKFLIFQHVGGGNFLSPELPAWSIVVLNVLYAWVFVWATFALFSGEKAFIRISICAALIALLMTYQGYKDPIDHSQDLALRVASTPQSPKPLTVVFLTDLHISKVRTASFLQRIVTRVNALKPDLVLLGGDLIDGTLATRKDDLLPLKHLSPRYGTYACLGNHEYFFQAQDWIDLYPSLNIHLLQNSFETLTIPHFGPITIAGQNDPIATTHGLPPDDSRFLQVLHEIPLASRGPIVLLRHRPHGSEKNAPYVDLQLTGHTHGGMLPGLSWAIRPIAGPYIHGLYQLDKMRLFVAPGTAIWDGFPYRLFCPSQINLLRINPLSER